MNSNELIAIVLALVAGVVFWKWQKDRDQAATITKAQAATTGTTATGTVQTNPALAVKITPGAPVSTIWPSTYIQLTRTEGRDVIPDLPAFTAVRTADGLRGYITPYGNVLVPDPASSMEVGGP